MFIFWILFRERHKRTLILKRLIQYTMTYIFIGAFCTNCLTAANSTENAYSYTLACLLLYRISFFFLFFCYFRFVFGRFRFLFSQLFLVWRVKVAYLTLIQVRSAGYVHLLRLFYALGTVLMRLWCSSFLRAWFICLIRSAMNICSLLYHFNSAGSTLILQLQSSTLLMFFFSFCKSLIQWHFCTMGSCAQLSVVLYAVYLYTCGAYCTLIYNNVNYLHFLLYV